MNTELKGLLAMIGLPLFLLGGLASCATSCAHAIHDNNKGSNLFFWIGIACFFGLMICFSYFTSGENADSDSNQSSHDWRDDKKAIYDKDGNVTGYIDKD